MSHVDHVILFMKQIFLVLHFSKRIEDETSENGKPKKFYEGGGGEGGDQQHF